MNRYCVASVLTSLIAALAHAGVAAAQDTAAFTTIDKPLPDDDIVVTGTRTAGRSRLDTASPVDVLSGVSLRQQGTSELGTALAAVAPSIDFPRPSATDGTDAIRPATLRGLSPSQTLVLINGTRAHTSSLLNVNGSVGRGSAAVDLNTIPTVALESIEVLRDGASAQYGSDAIAGVINLRLREARTGGGASVTYGLYDTDIETARGSRSVTGEHSVAASAWQGFGFGDDGFVTVSAEYQDRQPTSRGDYDPRVTPSVVDNRYGDPAVSQYTGWINAGTSISPAWKVYGWLGYQDRISSSAAFPRLVTAAAVNGLVAIYPNGFLPLIETRSRDLNSAGGLKGEIAGWTVDTNISYGRNRIDYHTRDSANYSYGAATQSDFYDGATIYDQLVGKVDLSRKLDVFQALNVAFGVEGRRERYQILQGEAASYGYGTILTATPGAQGFTGFSPANAVDVHREAVSGYVDLEAQVTDKLLLGIAGRGEQYSDFDWTGTGKLSARYDFARWFALRGTASTGFRAPSLQQSYYTSVTSVIQNGTAILTGTYPSTNAVATALGGKALEPEKSTNLSFGTVIRAGGFDFTVDAYRIHIRNQIGLSENILASANEEIAALLAPYSVSAARFFINGLASTTKGIDAVAHYRLASDSAGIFDFTIAGNVNSIDVTKVPTSTSAISGVTLFARSRILTIEQGTPGEKVVGTVAWSHGTLGATARVSYYGNVLVPGTLTDGSADYDTGRKAISDLELRYQPKTGPQFALGVNNAFDVYPNKTPAALNTTGVIGFPGYSPYGFNGRYFYVRAGLSW